MNNELRLFYDTIREFNSYEHHPDYEVREKSLVALNKIKNEYNIYPKTIYDIGSCILKWTEGAKEVWPDSEIVLFEAFDIFEEQYKDVGYQYHIGLLSNQKKIVDFYHSKDFPTSGSYYKENPNFGSAKLSIKQMETTTLDDVVEKNKYKLPDLVKIDVQGAELDVLKGGIKSLASCKYIVIELRNLEYNIGSPEKETVVRYLESMGYENKGIIQHNFFDADYFFIKTNKISINDLLENQTVFEE